MHHAPVSLDRKEFLHSLVLAGIAGPAAASALPRSPQASAPAPGSVGVLDVRATYGAAGDGVTDDTDAIQRAINDAARHGLNVYLPSGRYRVTRLLFHHDAALNPGFPRIPGHEGNFDVFGDGAITRAGIVQDSLQRTVVESDSPFPLMELDGGAIGGHLRAVRLSGMTLRSDNATQVLRLSRAHTFLNLTDLLVHQRGPGGGILVEDTWVDHWANVYVLGEQRNLSAPGSRGLVIRNVGTGGGNVSLVNVSTDRFRIGWEIGHSDFRADAQVLSCVTCIGCQATRNTHVGVLLGKGARSFNWIGSHVEQATGALGQGVGMLVKNFAQGVNVLGSWFSGNDTAIQVGDVAEGAGESTARVVNVQGNNIVNCLRTGVRVHASPLGGLITIESNSFSAQPRSGAATTGIALDDADLGGVTLRYNLFPPGGPAAFGVDVQNPARADLVQDPGTLRFHAASPVLDGTWSGSHLVMGEHHLWIDGEGRLRTKKGPPEFALDGLPV